MNFTKIHGKNGSICYQFKSWLYKEVKGTNEEKFICISHKSKFKCIAEVDKTSTGYEGDLTAHNHPPPETEKRFYSTTYHIIIVLK